MPSVESSRRLALAAKRFPNLTSAERAMLWFSDIDNVDRGEFAVAGTSPTRTDPSNDPARADEWRPQRQIRAALIRWLCVDHEALGLIDPKGIRVMGARIIGGLDLSLVSVPIPLALDNCVFAEPINLGGAEIPDRGQPRAGSSPALGTTTLSLAGSSLVAVIVGPTKRTHSLRSPSMNFRS